MAVTKRRPIIDCDIHHYTGFELIEPYLPRQFRDLAKSYGRLSTGALYFNGGVGGRMVDSFPPEGGPAGSSLEYMQKHHLDPNNVKYAILTGEALGETTMANYDWSIAYCRAVNDYTVDHWLSRDKRLRGSIQIPKQDPAASAKEIDRLGHRDDISQVLVLNGAYFPYGNRFYYPIYEACVKHNLPFTIHIGGEGYGINAPMTGAGYPQHYIETRAARTQVMMAHIASFIFEGVFEKFPDLKVVIQEAGVLWIAPFLWKLDQDWKGLRVQTPWVRKRPSEYFRDNFRVTTQPIEETPNREVYFQLLDSINAEETMMYCSDYPHWDYDSPTQALPKMPEDMAHRVYYQNAADLYGLPPADEEEKEDSA